MTSIDAIIKRQLLRWESKRRQSDQEQPERHRPALIVTVSHQTGSRGSYFASRLAQRLGYQRLHRDAIDRISETPEHRTQVFESLDDHQRSEVDRLADNLLAKQTDDGSDYIRNLVRVVLSMARLGGVILMECGASFILGPACGFHVRVVCPHDKRSENLVKYTGKDPSKAKAEIDSSDTSRPEFVKKYFSANIEDCLNYDLVMNSAFVDVEEMVEIAVGGVKAKMNKLTFLDHDCM